MSNTFVYKFNKYLNRFQYNNVRNEFDIYKKIIQFFEREYYCFKKNIFL